MCKTIKQKLKFKASAQEIYGIFVDSKKLHTLTGKKASVSEKVGEVFSVQSGFASGINVDFLTARRIVRAWRSKEFPVGVFSMVSLDFQPTKSGGTELTLTHRGVPKALIPKTEAMWKDVYWKKLKNRRNV